MATPIPPNEAGFTLGEIAAATGGVLLGGARDVTVCAVSSDSRAIAPGMLFVALAGQTQDCYQHVAMAARHGAAAVLVRHGTVATGPRIEVEDTLDALGRLARAHVERERRRRVVPSLAITGSAGKTTTKELAAAVVRAVYGEILATQGNLNNLVGVPMTLLTLSDAHRAMVIECGTSARGEIARLGAIVAPDVGVVLNADAGHTAGLGALADVAVEKGAMFLAAGRFAVGNADDPASLARLAFATVPALTFGVSPVADVRLIARSAQPDGCTQLRIALPAHVLASRVSCVLEAPLVLPGLAAALDATAAIAALAALHGSLSGDDLARVSAALGAVKPTPGRFVVTPVGDVTVIDDTYNANPRSMRSSIATARELAGGRGGRLVLVLGDMLELGELSERMHAEIGNEVLRVRADVLVTVGERMATAARVASRGARAVAVVETRSTGDAVIALGDTLRAGDVVLVKGSRGMRMEGVIEQLVHDRGAEKVGP